MTRLTLAAMVLLTGCAATPRQDAARFDFAQKQCAASIDQMPINSVPRITDQEPRAALTVDFQKAAGCLAAKDGKPVPLMLLALDGRVPSEVRLEIAIQAEIAFAAAIDVLDTNKQVVRTVPFSAFVKRGAAYTLTLFLNEDDRDARFLVLRPDSANVGKSQASVVGVTNSSSYVVASGGAIYGVSWTTGSEIQARTWLSEVGRVKVMLTDYDPSALAPKN